MSCHNIDTKQNNSDGETLPGSGRQTGEETGSSRLCYCAGRGSSLGCFQALLPGITPADKDGGGRRRRGMQAEGGCGLHTTLSPWRSERVHRQGFVPEAFPERGRRSGSSLPFPETWQPLNSCHHPQQTMSTASPGPAAAPGAREQRNCRELAGDQEAAQTAGVTDPLVTTKRPGRALSRPEGLASCSRARFAGGLLQSQPGGTGPQHHLLPAPASLSRALGEGMEPWPTPARCHRDS